MKVLIFSPDSFSIFRPDTRFIFGGIEIETGYYARGLAAKPDLQVIVVTKDQGYKTHRIEGVTLYPHPYLKGDGYWRKRTTLLGRIKYRLWPDDWPQDIVSLITPDVIYTQGLCRDALELMRTAKQQNIKYVFRLASDMDLGEQLADGTTEMTWSGLTALEASELYGLADQVMTQTPYQQQTLLKRFGRESIVLYNPIRLDNPAVRNEKYDAIWIGKSSGVKRPGHFITLAGRLPHRRFLMILNKHEPAMWQELTRQLPPNLQLIESVPAPNMPAILAQCRVLVNTSSYEGFPNTFLQSAAAGVPVLSMTQDPNGMLTKHGAGIMAGDSVEALAVNLENLLNDSNGYNTCSNSARQYVFDYHDAVRIVEQFYHVLCTCAA